MRGRQTLAKIKVFYTNSAANTLLHAATRGYPETLRNRPLAIDHGLPLALFQGEARMNCMLISTYYSPTVVQRCRVRDSSAGPSRSRQMLGLIVWQRPSCSASTGEHACEYSDHLPASHTYHHTYGQTREVEIPRNTCGGGRATPCTPSGFLQNTWCLHVRGAQITVRARLHFTTRCSPRTPPTCRSRSA